MKKIIVAILTASLFTAAINAQELKFFNHWGTGLTVGTEGISLDFGTCITGYLTLRGGVDYMPGFSPKFERTISYDVYSLTTGFLKTIDTDTQIKGNVERFSGHVMFDIHPLGEGKFPFYITVGSYFGGDRMLVVDFHSDKIKSMIGDLDPETVYDLLQIREDQKKYNITANENGDAILSYNVSKVRPYVGLGIGSLIPSQRVYVRFELGVQYNGKAQVIDLVTNTAEDYTAIISRIAPGAIKESMIKVLDVAGRIYPCLKIGVAIKLF
ncbi:MAG: hypothetical protein HUJ95_02710 [Bacteroidales bacterium]|nr:hypothetical protein [Bacteroidales bacterium]